MIIMKKLIVIISILNYLQCIQSSDLCKLTGFKSQFPDIFSLFNEQAGYSTIIEIVEPDQQLTFHYKDVFDSSTRIGKIEWLNSQDENEMKLMKSIHYYVSTRESFIINNGSKGCETRELTIEDKNLIVTEWTSPGMKNINAKGWSRLLGLDYQTLEHLGPTIIMIMASEISKSSGYSKGQTTIDGIKVNQWSICLSPDDSDLVIDAYFLTGSNLPYRLVISSQSSPSKNNILVNFLTFEPTLIKANPILSFPIGHGCKKTYKNEYPKWTTSNSYLIEMEAAISSRSPEKLQLSTLKFFKHQNTYSYLISQGESNTMRIIKSPWLLKYFKVNPQTGSCSIEIEKTFSGVTSPTVITQWPLLTDDTIKYNLLSPALFTLSGTSFLGVTETGFGIMRVFEKVFDSFFVNSANERVSALIQFYFLDAVNYYKYEHPHHIVIIPFLSSVDDEVLMDSIPSRIEITYVNYKTGDDTGYLLIDPIDYEDAFDVSGCYDEPGQSTWFQLVFPDTTLDIARYQRRDAVIYHSFVSLIEPIIPLLRLPEIRVTIFGPSIYVTCKLLQAEIFNFISMPYEVISNPSRLVVREFTEDCSELCLDSEHCSAFAHCSNMECYLFNGSVEDGVTYETEHRENCTVYVLLSSTRTKTQVEMNLLKSSKNILHQLKRNLKNLVLPNLAQSAGDLFILNNPDEIGGVDAKVPIGQLMDKSLTGDNFQVLIPNQRFISDSRVVGLDYQSCLSLCANDDDCYTLSYCSAQPTECVIMDKTSDQVKAGYKKIATYVDGCDILSKSFGSFFRKLPGRSLVVDSVLTLPSLQPDECARKCILSTDFDCQSFDYCPQIKNNQDKKAETACFLHTLHVASDRAHQLEGNIWDFSNAECDHYSRRLSKDYQHFIGRKLNYRTEILQTKEDVSLENCAFQCNDLTDDCSTFEYCESKDISTCRLTNYLPYGSDDDYLAESSFVSSNSSLCSVYVNKKSYRRSVHGQYDEVEGGLGMAVSLGAFFFIAAFAIGIVSSHLYMKKFV